MLKLDAHFDLKDSRLVHDSPRRVHPHTPHTRLDASILTTWRRGRDGRGFFALFVVLCACGAGGPMFDLVDVPPIVRNSWRSQISAMFLFPSLCWSCYTDDGIRWTTTVILSLLVVGVCLELSYATWNIALEMTTFPRTALFAQVHPVFILLGAACASLVSRSRSRSQRVTFPSRTEWFGVGVTISGAIITATYSNRRDQQRPSSIAGDLVALCSGAAYAAYIASMRRWFTNVSVFIVQGFATIIMMMCSFLILAIVPDQADWSITSPYGVFAGRTVRTCDSSSPLEYSSPWDTWRSPSRFKTCHFSSRACR